MHPDLQVVSDRETGRSRGFGFVSYNTEVRKERLRRASPPLRPPEYALRSSSAFADCTGAAPAIFGLYVETECNFRLMQ